jgi:hypothetical protein
MISGPVRIAKAPPVQAPPVQDRFREHGCGGLAAGERDAVGRNKRPTTAPAVASFRVKTGRRVC